MRDSLARTMPVRHSMSPRRSILLYGFLGMLCFVRTIESGPLPDSNGSPRLESTGTLASVLQSKKGQEEEVGNPSEIAYQAWLLIDGHPDSQPLGGLDSASLLRRIKPKSIFVAPNLTACPEGYQDDTMNRCVKDVNIDHQAHKGFLVQRLQAIFGSKSHAAASSSASSSSSSSSSSSIPSGPLQLNIPLIMAAPVKPPREKISLQPLSFEKPPPTTDSSKSDAATKDKAEDHPRDAIVTVYELNEDESTFFLGNKSSTGAHQNFKGPAKRPDILVPIAEFVDETGSNFSGVVDYKIRAIPSQARNLTIGDSDQENRDESPAGDQDDAKEPNVSPTLVLLLSPTKIPSISVPGSDLIVAHNSSLGQVVIKMENVTGNATKEIIRVSVPDELASSTPTRLRPDLDGEDATTDSKTSGEESTESTDAYYEEEENYEESTENEDEILKHSEAGMTVTLPAPGERATLRPAATAYSDKEPTGSGEISSEVSINGDFVRETTLVDFNASKPPNSTSSSIADDAEGLADWDAAPSTDAPAVNDNRDRPLDLEDEAAGSDDSTPKKPTPDDNSSKIRAPYRQMPIVVLPERSMDEELAENAQDPASSTEKSDSAETMLASSTNDAGTFVSREIPKFDPPYYSSSKKRAGQPFRFEATTKIPQKLAATLPNVQGVYDYEPGDYPRRNPYGLHEDAEIPLIRTIDQQRYRPEDEQLNFFPPQQQSVRFPAYDRHGRPNYVRFPSEEANSIHPNDYKERRTYSHYQQQQQQQLNYGRVSAPPKNLSGQDVYQKQSYWWLPPGWRTDKHQQELQQRSRATDDSRTPMLLRFWTRMPLVRDPSLSYQQHPTYPTLGARDGAARRVNFYKEISTQDLDRAFARKSLTSAIGG